MLNNSDIEKLVAVYLDTKNQLTNIEGVSIKGTPSYFTLRNVGINALSLNIAI